MGALKRRGRDGVIALELESSDEELLEAVRFLKRVAENE